MVTLSPGIRMFLRTKDLTQDLSRKSHRVLPVLLSVGMSVFTGFVRPLATIVIGVPNLDFVEPPKTSGGKKSLPQELRFRLPCLWAAGVSLITRESIPALILSDKGACCFI